MNTNKQQIIIYEANPQGNGLWQALINIFKDIRPAHELATRLFKRDIKAQYRQSFLGFFWVLIPPLLTAGLWIFLNDNKIINVGETVIPYPLFVMIGTILWQIFAESVNQPRVSVNSDKAMLTKINFPREALVLSGFYTISFNLIPKFLVLIAACYFFDVTLNLSQLYFPLGIIILSLSGFTIGLLLTPASLLIPDIARGIGIFLPFVMYLTPVIYPTPASGNFSLLMSYNPLATLINTSRDWLTGQITYIPHTFSLIAIIAFILLLIGIIAYRISMPIITERFGG